MVILQKNENYNYQQFYCCIFWYIAILLLYILVYSQNNFRSAEEVFAHLCSQQHFSQ